MTPLPTHLVPPGATCDMDAEPSGSPMLAPRQTANDCATCLHKGQAQGGWCYMFRDKPVWQCAQHMPRDTSALHVSDAAPKIAQDSERAAFEAWCCRRWRGSRGGLAIRPDGEYETGPIQFAWSAWQAARASIQKIGS